MAVINVNFDEVSQDSYESVEITYSNKKTTFKSGNFVKDWFDLIKFIIIENILETEYAICNSSSVDHFIMSGDKYMSLYLKMIDGKPYLIETNENDEYIEIFVLKDTYPSWKELKKLCK